VEQNGDKKRILSGIGVEIETWSREESRPALDITEVDYCVDFVRIKVLEYFQDRPDDLLVFQLTEGDG
jgi:hypothetical protein